MGFGEFGLGGLGIVEAEERHGEVVVGVGEGGIEADGLAVARGGFLKFSGVEESGALVEAKIRVIGLQGNEFLIGGDGIVKFVGG